MGAKDGAKMADAAEAKGGRAAAFRGAGDVLAMPHIRPARVPHRRDAETRRQRREQELRFFAFSAASAAQPDLKYETRGRRVLPVIARRGNGGRREDGSVISLRGSASRRLCGER